MKLFLYASLAGCSLAVCSCDNSAAQRTAESEAATLKAQNEFLTETMAKATNDAKAAQRGLDDLRAEQNRKDGETRASQEALKKQLIEVQKSFEQYKEKYRVSARKRAPGLKLAMLACGTEEVYKDVEILTITPGQLNIRHSSGLAKVPMGRLEHGLRERFAYDADEATAWLASERKKELEAEAAKQERIIIGATGSGGTSAGRARQASSRQAYNPQTRLNYVAQLNKVYANARAVQACNSGCPVHKRYELQALAQDAEELKRTIASLPKAP